MLLDGRTIWDSLELFWSDRTLLEQKSIVLHSQQRNGGKDRPNEVPRFPNFLKNIFWVKIFINPNLSENLVEHAYKYHERFLEWMDISGCYYFEPKRSEVMKGTRSYERNVDLRQVEKRRISSKWAGWFKVHGITGRSGSCTPFILEQHGQKHSKKKEMRASEPHVPRPA